MPGSTFTQIHTFPLIYVPTYGSTPAPSLLLPLGIIDAPYSPSSSPGKEQAQNLRFRLSRFAGKLVDDEGNST